MLKVPQVPQDLLVLQEPLVLLALLVQLEIQAQLEHKEQQDLLDLLVMPPLSQVRLAPQVQQEPLQQSLAQREPQVLLAR